MLESAEDSWIVEAEAHGNQLLAAGITRVGDAAVPPAMDLLYERAVAADRLPVIVHRMPIGSASFLEPRRKPPATGSGPALAPVGATKLFLDGADQCAVCMSKRQLAASAAQAIRAAVGGGGLAALRAAARLGGWRRSASDALLHRGELFTDASALAKVIAAAAESGSQVAQHAIGNEATALALSALESNGQRLGELPGSPRLEHVMMLEPALESRIAATGAVAVVQPLWISELGDELRLLPMPAPLRTLGLRSLLDAGVTLAGSSDYPIAGFDVLSAVQAAVTRRTRSGLTFAPDQALSVDEALAAYTRGSAEALGVGHETGTLEAGKRADLVVLGADPLGVDPEQIARIPVLRTYLAGRLAHRLDPVREHAPPR